MLKKNCNAQILTSTMWNAVSKTLNTPPQQRTFTWSFNRIAMLGSSTDPLTSQDSRGQFALKLISPRSETSLVLLHPLQVGVCAVFGCLLCLDLGTLGCL